MPESSASAEPVCVFNLSDLDRNELAIAGGKGANLGELLHAGFPVPDGFIVATSAYDWFLSYNHLDQTIASALADERDAGASIRKAMEDAPMPPDVERDISAAYERLQASPVAVRSSATAEDLPEAAFAGQQDTFLNVIGVRAVLDAVRRCWASLWTDRAITYRERQAFGRGGEGLKLAVVVQRMVAADVAGVLFTANPVTGARDQMVVDANPGLGESVVSGLATPDHYVVRKRWWGWRTVERRIGRREVVVRPLRDGGTEHITGRTGAAFYTPALTNRQLRRLARLGAAIERHFDAPQDVEWAFAGSRLFIVQARPITALPQPTLPPQPLVRIVATLITEMLPARPYPLEDTTWGFGLAVSALLGPLLGVIGLALRTDKLFVQEDGVVVRYTGHLPVRPTPWIVLAPFRLLRQARRYDVTHWEGDPLIPEALARARTLEARDLRALSWAELLTTVREALAIPMLLGEHRVRYMPGAIVGFLGLRLLLGLLGRVDCFDVLLAGVHTKTLESNRALEALAARIRAEADLADAFAHYEPDQLHDVLEAQPRGRAFLEELHIFLDQYGHREAGGTFLVSQSTWKDAPEVVLGILKGLATAPAPLQTQAPNWQKARKALQAHPILRVPPLRSAFFQLLDRARYFAQLREDTRFYGTVILPVLHRTLLEFGRRLALVGVLDRPEDVFHLRFDELERIDAVWPPPAALTRELRERIQHRKRRRAELENIPLVDPRLIRSDAVQGEALVRGTPGSPGMAEGLVRVIRNTSEFARLQAGDVLVAPYTNPAWTPLFQHAAAVVVDSGGAMSHAAIVAREYGIPAVMGTADGTSRLEDGQRVRVDGTRGVVSRT
jgi:rifampicin phosphotransferase